MVSKQCLQIHDCDTKVCWFIVAGGQHQCKMGDVKEAVEPVFEDDCTDKEE